MVLVLCSHSFRAGSGVVSVCVSTPEVGREQEVTLSRNQVEKVSLLGRLLLSPEEIEKMTDQMGAILDYMDLLSEVDTEAVEPMAHALDVSDVLREDEVRPSLPRNRALANAPSRDDQCYRVPAVLGEL